MQPSFVARNACKSRIFVSATSFGRWTTINKKRRSWANIIDEHCSTIYLSNGRLGNLPRPTQSSTMVCVLLWFWFDSHSHIMLPTDKCHYQKWNHHLLPMNISNKRNKNTRHSVYDCTRTYWVIWEKWILVVGWIEYVYSFRQSDWKITIVHQYDWGFVENSEHILHVKGILTSALCVVERLVHLCVCFVQGKGFFCVASKYINDAVIVGVWTVFFLVQLQSSQMSCNSTWTAWTNTTTASTK